MIHELGQELHVALRSKGVPVAVINGPEPTTTTTWARERIVLEFDKDGTDSFGDIRSLQTNPRHRYTAVEACKLTLYVQSPSVGATTFEHRARAKRLRDEILVAMDLVAAQRRNRWRPLSGAFEDPPDLEKSERPAGAVYVLKFSIEQAVRDLTWAGAAQPEATITGVTSATHVTRAPAPDDDPPTPQTACGA